LVNDRLGCERSQRARNLLAKLGKNHGMGGLGWMMKLGRDVQNQTCIQALDAARLLLRLLRVVLLLLLAAANKAAAARVKAPCI